MNNKIIYLNGRFLTQNVTGVQRVAHEILKELDLMSTYTDFKFVILVPKNADDIFGNLELKNIEIKKIGFLKGHLWEQIELPLYTIGGALINFCNTAPLFKRNQFVYIHDAAVYSRPNGYSRNFVLWYKIIYSCISKYAKRIMTVSEFSKMDLIDHLPVLKGKIRVSHIAVNHMDTLNFDEGILKKEGLEKNKYLLAVSSMHPNKNFQVIIDALENMTEFNEQIVIAGGQNVKVFSNVLMQERNNIKFVGYVTDEQLKSLYSNARAFIFPSYYEGFGLPPLEAMSLGCPVIASTAASIPEICGEAALYFNPDKPMDLVRRINEVYENDQIIQDMKTRGLQRSKDFNWKQTTENLLEEIEKYFR